MQLKKTIFILLLTFSWMQHADAYERPAHISEKVWEEVLPYLLPEYHPAKPVLDRIFSSSRAVFNSQSMEDAGFVKADVRPWTCLMVTRHPELEGYIIKTFLDSQYNRKVKLDFEYWIMRIEGVKAIENLLDENHWHHIFKVPNKWIYTLPEDPAPPSGIRKNFILIEDDMGILDKEANKKAWKSKRMTKEKLKKFFTILETIGLSDCAKCDNVPFCTDGRIAFVDTQTSNSWPIDHKKFTKSLPPELQDYWKELIKKRKKKKSK
jgi:hypothetical protein